jgi:hypothetical protein
MKAKKVPFLVYKPLLLQSDRTLLTPVRHDQVFIEEGTLRMTADHPAGIRVYTKKKDAELVSKEVFKAKVWPEDILNASHGAEMLSVKELFFEKGSVE